MLATGRPWGILEPMEWSMFREYDIRGRESAEELNPRSAELIARGYGTFLEARGISEVVVGHDNRATSEDLYEAAIRGLVRSGRAVTKIGTVLTPMLYWSQYHLRSRGGLMVTASHNPAGWNGMKLACGYSHTLNAEEIAELREIVRRGAFAEGEGRIEGERDIFPAYLSDLQSRTGPIKPIRIVVNTGNGTAGLFAPRIFRAVGCEVVEHLTAPDPSYPNYTPNPAQTEMMEDTGRIVREAGADLGFALDGDGDRLGLADEKGQNIWPDRYLILLSRLVLKKNPGAKIVFDVKVSQALVEDIAAHGGVPIMWKTGHSYIKQKMQEEQAALAGEMSGHVFFADGYYGFDDAAFVGLKLLEYVSSEDAPLSELVARTPSYVSSPALHASCPDDRKYGIVEDLTEAFRREGFEVIDINGARVVFPDGWGLVRASSNLPALVLRFESKSREGLSRIERVFREKLEAYEEVGKEWYPA